MDEIAKHPACQDYTGADLAALVREASVAAFRELVLEPNLNQTKDDLATADLKVSKRHFEAALHKIKPSVSQKNRQRYAEMKEKYSQINGQ